MKKSLATLGFLTLFAATPLICWTTQAHAGNSSVEATLQSYGDLSMFYQALLNTGVINQLDENSHYTIFAPTNAAFTEIRPQTYPCFYAEQCRPQIAALLKNHIIMNRHDYADLATYGQGIASMGQQRLHVVETYPGKYAVNGQTILSKSEVGGNIVYRIDGVITNPQELAQFQTVNYVPAQGTYTTERTVTEKTYAAPGTAPQNYPGGDMVNPANALVPADQSETTTVIHSYTTEP